MEVSTMDDVKDEYDDQRSLVQDATQTLLFPLRVATSPPLLRTYLRTALLLITSTVLFAFAVIAYTSFYYSYIPVRGISVPVYLQFDHGVTPRLDVSASGGHKWPHGIASLHGLVNRQKYDVSVEMVVPRSRTNLRAGNWMLELSLRGPASSGKSGLMSVLGWDEDVAESESESSQTATVAGRPTELAHSRRPAILTYRSWPTEHLHRLLRLPLYLTGFGTESETLHVRMLEGAYFATTAPASLRLELRSRAPLEVYAVAVHITARLEGLRWLMYTYRLFSAVVFVAAFWATEMGVLLFTWGIASMLFRSTPPGTDTDNAAQPIKASSDYVKTELSDTDHTFPSLSAHQPLHYTSPDDRPIKPEPHDLHVEDVPAHDLADDEDDDFVLEEPGRAGDVAVFTDSGLGTGVDSERERVRRRGSARRGKER